MTTKSKATLFVLGTFLLGVLVGALINGAIMSSRSRNLNSLPPGPLLASIVERVIQPDAKQRDAIMKILEKHSQTMAAAAETFRETMTRTIDCVQSELDPLLTPEQRQRLRESIERPMMRLRMHQGPGVEGISMLKEKLDLSDQQVSKIKEIFGSLERETAALLENTQEDPMSLRQKMAELGRATEEKINAVLTPAQQKKFHEIQEFVLPEFPNRDFPPFGDENREKMPPWDSTSKNLENR